MHSDRKISLEDVLDIIDSDEFYEMLPGDGQDDFICGWLKKKVKELDREERRRLANA